MEKLRMINIQKLETSPKALDAQSIIIIDEWVVLDSPKHKETDTDYVSSKKMLETGSGNGFLKIDSLGRIWVHGAHEEMYPYHYEYGSKLYGLRIATAAAN
jgi:hypothetical protein